jgi:hypothetical protein
MKNIAITCAFVCALFIQSNAFSQRFDQLDEAPVDIAYLRPSQKSAPLVKVVYSRPSAADGKVFGNQVPYGELWRTGANEATEITFYKDMLFGNKLVRKGTYVMHTIPGKKEWTIILNSNTDTWGAFFYNPEKDVARIKIRAKKDANDPLDLFSIAFKKDFKDSYMVLAWDETRVDIPLDDSSPMLAKI